MCDSCVMRCYLIGVLDQSPGGTKEKPTEGSKANTHMGIHG